MHHARIQGGTVPRRSKADSEATAEAVLTAAYADFGARGYAAVRIDDVAAAAGVTRGAVYHHYTDKPGLFAPVVARAHARVGLAVAEAADAMEDPWESFVAGCHAFLTACTDDAHRRIVLVDAPAVLGWDAWRAQDAEHAGRHLVEALEALDEAGLLAVASLPAAAALLSGAMNEAALWVAAEQHPSALDEATATLDVLLGSLRAR
jgi:AcrR family transcriptional regulator